MGPIKALRYVTVKSLAITFGTTYIATRLVADTVCEAEAKLVHFVDGSIAEDDVRKAREQSYIDVCRYLHEKKDLALNTANTMKAKLIEKLPPAPPSGPGLGSAIGEALFQEPQPVSLPLQTPEQAFGVPGFRVKQWKEGAMPPPAPTV